MEFVGVPRHPSYAEEIAKTLPETRGLLPIGDRLEVYDREGYITYFRGACVEGCDATDDVVAQLAVMQNGHDRKSLEKSSAD